MNSSRPAAFNPFKSKKIIQSSSKSVDPPQTQSSDPITPQKSIHHLSSRSRNRGVVLSLKEVRKVAEGLRESKKAESLKQPDPILSIFTPSKKEREKQIPVKLPEKYQLLVDFFECMESSIRLLNLKGTMTSFSNISAAVESLKDRRFTYTHLAQLKYILPEGIVLKKVRVHDERTLCMKPDLQITLQNDALETPLKARSGFASLRKEFHSRLVDFIKAHPEGDDVPEEALPEPFNRPKQVVLASVNPLPIVSSSSTTLPQKTPALATHLAPSFTRRFSQKNSIPELEKRLSTLKPPKPHFNVSCSKETPSPVVPSPVKSSSKLPIVKSVSTIDAYLVKIPPSSPLSTCVETKTKTTEDCSPADIDAIKGTPAKLISTPARLMTSTPDLQTPKRFHMYQDDYPTPSPDIDAIKGTPAKLISTLARLMTSTPDLQTPKRFHMYQDDYPTPSPDIDAIKGTPAKLISSPARLMTSTPDLQTPDLQTPKRFHMYRDDDSSPSPTKLTRRPPTNRSLFNTPMKNVKAKTEVNEEEGSSADLDSLKLLPDTLVQSILDNGRRIREEQDSDISRAKLRKRMIAALPKMYDMILLIFQSIKRSVVTKEELIHKIIASHCDIVDRGEVEEQLTLLREFIPEYIWEKVASTGDILLCINKTLSVESSRRRLAEAE